MKSWYDIYLNEIKLKKNAKNYIEDKIRHKKVFISMLKKYGDKGAKKLIEAGCGTGIISSYIATKGYDVIGIDIDEKILKLANSLAVDYFQNNEKIQFERRSIFEMNYEENSFDVSFSNGVLEHFSDDEITQTIEQQLYVAKYVVIGIPTQFFDKSEALYGNERFLPSDYWRYLITKSGGRILEEHTFHYMTLLEKLKSLKKMKRPKPFTLFVVEKL